jgi:hypothetical protein
LIPAKAISDAIMVMGNAASYLRRCGYAVDDSTLMDKINVIVDLRTSQDDLKAALCEILIEIGPFP